MQNDEQQNTRPAAVAQIARIANHVYEENVNRARRHVFTRIFGKDIPREKWPEIATNPEDATKLQCFFCLCISLAADLLVEGRIKQCNTKPSSESGLCDDMQQLSATVWAAIEDGFEQQVPRVGPDTVIGGIEIGKIGAEVEPVLGGLVRDCPRQLVEILAIRGDPDALGLIAKFLEDGGEADMQMVFAVGLLTEVYRAPRMVAAMQGLLSRFGCRLSFRLVMEGSSDVEGSIN